MNRTARVLFLLAALAFPLTPLLAEVRPAAACYCVAPQASELLLQPILVRATPGEPGATTVRLAGAAFPSQIYPMRVSAVWRGEVPADAMFFDTFSSCAATLEPGREYVLTAARTDTGLLGISSCSYIRELGEGGLPDDLAFLGPGRAPGTADPGLKIEDDGIHASDALVTLGVLVLAAGALTTPFAWVARRRAMGR